MAEQIRLDLIVDSKGAAKNVKNLRKEVKATGVDTKKVTSSFKGFTDTVTKGLTSSTATAALFASGNVQLQKAVGGVTIGLQGLSAAQVFFNTTTKGGVTALKLFKIALAATGIGALVIALGSLVTFLTKTKRGIEIMNKVSAALGAVMDVLIDRVSTLGGLIFDAFSKPKQTIIDLGNSIRDFVLKEINQITEGLGLLGKAITLAFDLNFKEAAKTALEGAKSIAKGLTPVDDIINKVVEGTKSLVKEITEEGKAAFNLEDRLNKLVDAERAVGVERAASAKQIAELRFIAEDRTESEERRLEAIQEAGKIEEAIVAKEVANAQERAAITSAQISLGESLEEDLQKEADARIALDNLLTNSFNLRKSLASREEGLRREVETVRKENKAKRETEEKEKQDIIDRDIQALLDQKELDAETEIERRDLVVAQAEFDLQQLGLTLEEENLIKSKALKELEGIEIEFSDKQKNRDKEAADFRLSVTTSLLSTISSLTNTFAGKTEKAQKKAFIINKALGIAQASIQTFQSATAAYASQLTIPTPDAPIRAAIAAGVAVAAGLANIAKISATKFKGGVPGGASTPSGSIGGGGGTPRPPQLGAVQTTILDPDGTVPDLPEVPTVKAVVVETDITENQKRVKRIEDQATFG